MAKYVMQEIVDLNREGETLLRPRVVSMGRLGSRDLARVIAGGTTFGEAETLGVLGELGEKLAAALAMGYSVRLDGVGTFSPTLRLKEGRESEEPGGRRGRRNARSVELGGVSFRADRELLRKARGQCRLERDGAERRLSRSPWTAEERVSRALRFLEGRGTMTVGEYAALNSLGRSAATRELRALAAREDAPIKASGSGSHKVYRAAPREEGDQ